MDGQVPDHHAEPGSTSTGLLKRRHLDMIPCRWWQRNRRRCRVPLAAEPRAAQTQKTLPTNQTLRLC